MSGQWNDILSGGSRIAAVFEGELRQHLAAEYEEDDELVKHVIDQLKIVKDKDQLHAEFIEVFDDGAEDMANWCWNTVQQLCTEPQEEAIDSAPEELLDNDDEDYELEADDKEEGELGDSPAALAEPDRAEQHEEQQQPAKRAKRQPIKFDLGNGAPVNTVPHKASSVKFQQQQHTAAESVQDRMADSKQAVQPTREQRKAHVETRSRSALQPEAPQAAGVPVTRSGSAPGRAAAIGADATQRQHAGAAAGAALAGLPHRQPQSPGARESRTGVTRPAAGETAGSSRKLAGTKRGAGAALVGRALQGIVAVAGVGVTDRAARPVARSRQQQQQRSEADQSRQQPAAQQQQPRRQTEPDMQSHLPLSQRQSRVSVLDRLGAVQEQQQDAAASGKHSVFERLGTAGIEQPAAEAAPTKAAATATATADRSAQQQKQRPLQTQQGTAVDSKSQRLSVYKRLGSAGGGDAAVVKDAAAAAVKAGVQQQQQEQRRPAVQQPPAAPSSAAPAAVAPVKAAAAGAKRKAAPASEANGTTNAAATAPGAGPAAKKPVAVAKPGKATGQAAEVALMRQKIAQQAAEVERLKRQNEAKARQEQLEKLQQEEDSRSIVVFGVSPIVPDSVVRAHFQVCGPIKRCTLLPRRHQDPAVNITVSGAFLEFETTTAKLQALGFTGSILFDQEILVQGKAEFRQGKIKAKESFEARQKAASAAAVGGMTWGKPPAVAVTNTATGAAATGQPESPASQGSLDLGFTG